MVMTRLPHYETTDVRIEKIVVGPFENNVFVLRCKGTGDAVIIDAANEHELLLEVSPRDRRAPGAHHARPLRPHPGRHADARRRASTSASPPRTPTMLPGYDFVIPDDDVIEVGDLRLRTIHTPGPHAGLHVLPARGSPDPVQRRHAVPRRPRQHQRSRAATSTRSSSRSTAGCSRCPADTLVLPGHGLDTTIASERPTSTSGSTAAGSAVTATRRDSATAACRSTATTSTYETVGAPDAPVVVLGHGAGGNHAIWFQQVPVFAPDYRVVTWDQRGFGLSTNRARARESRAPRPADLLAILDHLGVERAHVVGQSLGGWAAMGLAIAHPDRVRSLVLADTLGGIPVEGWWKAAAPSPRDGPFNHPALSNDFCVRHPERAHLYLQIGGLRRDPHADPHAADPHAGRRDLRRRRSSRRSRSRRCSSSAPTTRSSRPDWIADAAGASRAPGSRRSTAPATRPISSSPRPGTPWSGLLAPSAALGAAAVPPLR